MSVAVLFECAKSEAQLTLANNLLPCSKTMAASSILPSTTVVAIPAAAAISPQCSDMVSCTSGQLRRRSGCNSNIKEHNESSSSIQSNNTACSCTVFIVVVVVLLLLLLLLVS